MLSLKLIFIALIAYQNTAFARVVVSEETQNDWDKLKIGDSCQDCIHIIELFTDLLSNTDVQTKIKNELDKLCDLIPGPTAPKLCREEVDKMLPLAITFLTGMANPDQVCSMLGLCESQSYNQVPHLLNNHIQEGVKAALTMTKVQFTPQCTFCIYLITSLESMLPKVRTELEVIDLLGKVCVILPPSYREQCENLIEKYGKMLMDMLLSYASPKAICKLIQACDDIYLPVLAIAPLSDCDSCVTLAVLTRLQLGSNASELQTTSFLDSVCQLHPNALPKCDGFTKHHGHRLKEVLGKPEPALEVCERVGLCGAVGETGDPHKGLCSLGNIYRCRNLPTAQECGTVSFCQMYVWK
ncbi:hypothetical protein UPYG_G00283350 [Umbra pygmaea]|uniref:Uncharacterized protein n=1 Tax=Umbra pygmaea TaxID=75934 RepID=A0ABD0W459_UMBPY